MCHPRCLQCPRIHRCSLIQTCSTEQLFQIEQRCITQQLLRRSTLPTSGESQRDGTYRSRIAMPSATQVTVNDQSTTNKCANEHIEEALDAAPPASDQFCHAGSGCVF